MTQLPPTRHRAPRAPKTDRRGLGRTRILALSCTLLLLFSSPAYADRAALDALNQRFVELAEAGQLEEALAVAQTLVQQAEAELPVDDAVLADAVSSLGWAQAYTGDTDAAIQTLRRSEALYRVADGADPKDAQDVHEFLFNVYKTKVQSAVLADDDAVAEATREEILTWLAQTEADPLQARYDFLYESALHAYSTSHFGEAAECFELAIETLQNSAAPNPNDTLIPLFEYVAFCDQGRGDYAAAALHAERLLAAVDWQVESADNARYLTYAGMYNYLVLDVDRARTYLQRALEMYEQLAPDGPEVLLCLNWLGPIYLDAGMTEQGANAYQTALTMMETLSVTTGSDYRMEISKAHTGLGIVGFLRGKYDEAIDQYQQALTLAEAVHGPSHPDNANTLNRMGILLNTQARYDEGRAYYQTARAIYKAEPGFERDYARVTGNLADLETSAGNLDAASDLFFDALKTLETLTDAQATQIKASVEANQATLEIKRGAYTEARMLLDDAQQLLESLDSPDKNTAISVLSAYGALFETLGVQPNAELSYRRVLEANAELYGEGHPDVSLAKLSLAQILCTKGDYAAAEPLLLDATERLTAQFGADSPRLSSAHANLADLYGDRGDFEKAIFHAERAFELELAADDLPGIAAALNNLAFLHRVFGHLDDALAIQERAVEVFRELSNTRSPELATALANLGWYEQLLGDLEGARTHYEEARALIETVFGDEHPNLAAILSNLTGLALEEGHLDEAIAFETRALEIEALATSRILDSGLSGEDQLSAYLEQLEALTNTVLSAHLIQGKASKPAAQAAMVTLLRRKGLVLDTVGLRRQALKQHLDPHGRALLDELATLNEALAARFFEGAKASEIATLESRAGEIERELGTKVEAQVSSHMVTLAEVVERIPKDATLLEYTRYIPFEPTKGLLLAYEGESRLGGYAVSRSGEVVGVDLGELSKVEALVTEYRTCVKTCDEKEFKVVARKLYVALIEPLETNLGEREHVFISPDDVLNLLPFESLVDGSGRYLLQTREVSYLGSGRDLVHITDHRVASLSAPMILANPNFGDSADNQTNERGMSGHAWAMLPGTVKEASVIASLLPGVRLLTGADASEEALKAVVSPSILHIATHGFFLDAKGAKQGRFLPSRSGFQVGMDSKPAAGESVRVDALLRSGVVLSGANLSHDGGEDGVASARELSMLDLQGTQLVVLSACDTGVGELRPGQGVYGLRRALTLAGAESQVMSLWAVSDKGTQALMIAFYRRLMDGEGTSEALRNAKLELMNSEEWAHPYYWAPFISTGDWRPLELSIGTADADALAVRQGCGCSLARTTHSPSGLLLGVLCAIGVMLVRSRVGRS